VGGAQVDQVAERKDRQVQGHFGGQLVMKNNRLRTRPLNLAAYLVPWLLAAPIVAQTEGNPPGRAARLSVIEGQVSFQPSGENDWSQATLNYTMTTGDRIYTYDGSRAELEVGPWAARKTRTSPWQI